MEYITISKTKIKLMLTQRDVEKYKISPSGRNAGSEFLPGFRRMLRDVRTLCGFNADEGRVLVRYFYGSDGGCEMYLTKLSERAAEPGGAVCDLNGSYLYRGEGPVRAATCPAIYRFPSLRELAWGCERLYRDGYSGRSEAYADRRGGGSFYLLLECERPDLAEYNGRLIPERSLLFIREHFVMFSRNAVKAVRGYY